jgi:hypothetical protein
VATEPSAEAVRTSSSAGWGGERRTIPRVDTIPSDGQRRAGPPLRILVVAPPWFPVPPTGYGGIEAVVSLLTEGLVAAGHEVTLVASGGSRTRGRLVTPFARPPSELIGDAFVEAAHALDAHDLRDGFDLVHDHSGAVAATLAAAVSGPPVCHTLHGPWTERNRALYRRVARRIALIAISHDQARRAPGDVPVAAVIHNALDLDVHRFRAEKEDLLVFVGRANPEKRPDVAIEVARRTRLPLVLALKVNEEPERRYFDEVVRRLPRARRASLLRAAARPRPRSGLPQRPAAAAGGSGLTAGGSSHDPRDGPPGAVAGPVLRRLAPARATRRPEGRCR